MQKNVKDHCNFLTTEQNLKFQSYPSLLYQLLLTILYYHTFNFSVIAHLSFETKQHLKIQMTTTLVGATHSTKKSHTWSI